MCIVYVLCVFMYTCMCVVCKHVCLCVLCVCVRVLCAYVCVHVCVCMGVLCACVVCVCVVYVSAHLCAWCVCPGLCKVVVKTKLTHSDPDFLQGLPCPESQGVSQTFLSPAILILMYNNNLRGCHSREKL